MAWTVELDSDNGFIHTIYSGIVTKDDILDSMNETLKMISGKGPQKFLTEWIDAKSSLSTVQIHFIPNEWEDAGVSKKSVLALVVQEDAKSLKDAKFYENSCQNRGWRVCVFTQKKDAVEWLEKQKITVLK